MAVTREAKNAFNDIPEYLWLLLVSPKATPRVLLLLLDIFNRVKDQPFPWNVNEKWLCLLQNQLMRGT